MTRLPGLLIRLLGVITLIGALAVAAALLAGPTWLVVDNAPQRADAIVVLGGAFTRPLHAADLYQRGLAPVVYVSVTSRPMAYGELVKLGINLPAQHEVYTRILERKGVPSMDIHPFGKSSVSTLEEAESLARTMEATPQRLLIVTSPLHARRAKLIFEAQFPTTEVLLCPTPYEQVSTAWWTSRDTAIGVVLECMKTVYYLCGGGFRSTPA